MATSNRSDLLDGVYAKLDRAQEHIYQLDYETFRALHSDDGPLSFQSNIEGNVVSFQVSIRSAPPLRLGVIIGDCIHDLRSALDHLVYALAVAESKRDPPPGFDNLEFPIDVKGGSFEKIAKPRLGELSGGVRAVIRDAQPEFDVGCRFADYPVITKPQFSEFHPLAVLHHLSNRDKHRVLVPVWYRVVGWAPDIPPGFRTTNLHVDRGGPLENGAEIGRVTFVDGNPPKDVQVNAAFNVQIALDGIRTQGNVSTSLTAIYECIRGRLVPALIPFF